MVSYTCNALCLYMTLCLERVIEDHERLVPILACWPRENNNSLLFVHRPGKYRLLTRPQVQTSIFVLFQFTN